MTSSKTANYVYAAPNGSAGAPSFRKLVAADIPSLAASKITSDTLPVARGGTGQTSVDTTPTSGSSKMVTSGGVYTAIDEVKTSVTTLDMSTSMQFMSLQKSMIKAEGGFYVGNGTAGIDYKTSIRFNFAPKIVVIRPSYPDATKQVPQLMFFWISDMTVVPSMIGSSSGSSNVNNYVTLNGNTLSWYNPSSSKNHQFNVEDVVYYFFALGW